MKTFITALIGLICSLQSVNAQTTDTVGSSPFVIGETLRFQSAILKEQRRLNIYLPQSYHPDSAHTYPVIYLLDGSADEDFIHITGLVQFGSFPWVDLLPESIVVGIANVDRKRDFTFPTRNKADQKEFPTSGKSEAFISFLLQEVKPLIENRYRTDGTNTLIGQSLGGLLATEILFTLPASFDQYIIVSPSLWWDDESILQRELPDTQPPLKVYVAVGNEGPTMESTALRLMAKLQMLRRKSWEGRLVMVYETMQNANHGNILHQAVYNAFSAFRQTTAP